MFGGGLNIISFDPDSLTTTSSVIIINSPDGIVNLDNGRIPILTSFGASVVCFNIIAKVYIPSFNVTD